MEPTREHAEAAILDLLARRDPSRIYAFAPCITSREDGLDALEKLGNP